jgi:prepilin-type processing-associated H-X9-DG protein
MSDINSNKGNHANPDFYAEEGDHWSTDGYWTFPYGGRQEANYLFSDGRVEFMEAYHDMALYKTWYHGFGISPLPKIWNRGNRPF